MLWRWLISWLVWLSADPATLDLERPRAAAAVAAARASLATSAPTPAPPAPKPGECCGECGGRGYLVMPDGHRVACPCPADCPCKATKSSKKPAECPDGKCPVPGASPTPAVPARPAGGR